MSVNVKDPLIQINNRISTLDSLRGLAALSVILAHYLSIFNAGKVLFLSPLYIFIAAHEAVILFFVLSGYILTYHYAGGKNFSYKKFITLRVFRIYLPYIASIVFCVILYLLCGHDYNAHTWLGSQWHNPLNFSSLFNHFLLIGNFNTNTLNTAIWSLVHELRISIIFPVILYVLRFKPRVIAILGFAVFLISGALIVLDINPSAGFNNSYSYSVYYIFMFLTGGAIAKYQPILLKFVDSITSVQKTILYIGAIITYTYAHTVGVLFVILHIPLKHDFYFIIEDFFTTVAACYLIIAGIAMANKQTFFENKIPLFLGKISYSLYLIHVPVLCGAVNLLHEKLPLYAIVAISFLVSFIVATLFNKYVEVPVSKFGRSLFKFSKTNQITGSISV